MIIVTIDKTCTLSYPLSSIYRFAESVQGNDLERIFKRESLDLDPSSGVQIREHKRTSERESPNEIQSSIHEIKEGSVQNIATSREESLQDGTTAVYGTHINSMKPDGENGTELVIVKLAESNVIIPSKQEVPIHSNPVKIQILNKDLAPNVSEVVSEFQIKPEEEVPSSNTNSKPNDSVVQSDQMETITLQVDENTQFEAIGAMLNELQSNRKGGGGKEKNQSDKINTNMEEISDTKKINLQTSQADQYKSSLRGKVLPSKGRNRNSCDICLKSFRLTSKLAHHRSAAHSGVYFSCSTSECNKRYKTKDALLLHHKMSGHSDMALFDPNPKKTRRKKVLDNSSKRYSCEECSKTFLHLWDLCEHRQNKHNDPSAAVTADISSEKPGVTAEVYECRVCSKAFKNKALMIRHLNVVHTNERPFECTLCELKFKSSTNLKAHQTSHSNEKKFSCVSCEKQFAYKTSLVQHVKCQHGGEKPFRCPHCNKSFSQNGNLQEHIRIHTGYKPFTCDICGRKFTTSSQHRLHTKRHKGEKPWVCQFCPKAFLHKESWTAHIRRHRGERPFVCEFEFCKKSFAELWALKKHTRLHTGEKPYICQVCPKSFSDCSNLTKHRKTHLKETSVYPSILPSKSVGDKITHELISVRNNEVIQDASQILHEGIANNLEVQDDSSVKQPSAKRQVWNILNEAVSHASTSEIVAEDGISLGYQKTGPVQTVAYGETQVVEGSKSQVQNEEDDVQQIIYITYDAEDKELHALSENSTDEQTAATRMSVIPNTEEDVLSHLSVVNSADSQQPQERSIVIPSSQTTHVITENLQTQRENRSSIQHPGTWTMAHTPSTKLDLDPSVTNNVVGENRSNTSQEAAQMMISPDQQDEETGAATNSGGVYVDIRLSDNDLEQPIRLRVPPNFDPIAYATEYIQLNTASQSGTLIQNQNLQAECNQNAE